MDEKNISFFDERRVWRYTERKLRIVLKYEHRDVIFSIHQSKAKGEGPRPLILNSLGICPMPWIASKFPAAKSGQRLHIYSMHTSCS